ncbi:hypothetical protein ANN_27046 [Periplaneta americana]|uniref:Endonuclease/exonuclease/phosphatase domain-containing protein n=1 Tax=Periplaneta americana TaxID=6978 RepID=A0ABQ8RX36_PERAM|nr:hypothetical protein ANN_27046 [Periplaneta americana]
MTTNINLGLTPHTSESAHMQSQAINALEDNESDSDDGWQLTKTHKRSRQGYPKSLKTTVKRQHLEDSNQYAVLATDNVNEMQLDCETEPEQVSNNVNKNSQMSEDPKPPPVFIPGVTNIVKLIQHLSLNGIDTKNEITYKTLRNNEIKLMAKTIDSYRKLVNFLSKDNAEFHTYQLKQDRAYRIVIRNIHNSTSIHDIKSAIEECGYKIGSYNTKTSRTNYDVNKLTNHSHFQISIMAQSLRIGLWNANGLANRRQEVEFFLNIHKLDVLLISETHFTDKNYFNIPRYTIYDTKHPDGKAHGGTAVIVKSNLRQYESCKFEDRDIQATTVTVIIEDKSGPLAVSAVYCPPKYKITSELSTIFSKI